MTERPEVEHIDPEVLPPGVIKLKKIRIKYLRKYLSGKEDTFWSEREIGQVIEEDAFEGIIDKVLEIRGIPDITDTTKKPQHPKMGGEEMSKQIDVTGADVVEISIREDGKVVWVNVDGVCACRVCRIKELVIDDRRKG